MAIRKSLVIDAADEHWSQVFEVQVMMTSRIKFSRCQPEIQASRFKAPVNSARVLGGEKGGVNRPQFQRRLGVNTRQLADRLVVAGVRRQRTLGDGAQPEQP
jgi:hypothetical protein